ncbi:MAG: hypothetical protein ACRDUA_10495 [Micromonosporaceae bacterium]
MSEAVTLGGHRYVQRAPRSLRRYSWTIPFAAAAEVTALFEIEQGVLGGTIYLYDEWVARWNMLPAGAATPALGGDTGAWTPDTGGTITYGFSGTIPNIAVDGTGDALAQPVPVIVGRTYTLAAEASANARVRMRWLNTAGSTISTSDGATGTGRRTLTATAPASAASVQCRLDPTTPPVSFSQIQLIEGGAAIGWLPGLGMPRVALAGIGQAYRAGWVRDITAELTEVG